MGFIVYRGHFWLVCLKYQRVHFRAAVGALEKKNHLIFKESLWVCFATNQLQKHQKNGISVKVI